jgi:predicted DNA-binding transcriptional regulator AlpA
MRGKYSTREAAKKIGRSLPSIQRLIAAGTIKAPPVVEIATQRVRLWSERDIEKARKVLAGIKPGRRPRK